MKIVNHGKAAKVLTVLGIIGLGITVAEAIHGTVKAVRIIEEVEEEQMVVTAPEKVKIFAKCYWPTLCFGFSTAACFLGASKLNMKTQASLMSAYAFTDQTFRKYRKVVESRYGEETEADIYAESRSMLYNSSFHELDFDYPDKKVRWYEPISKTFFYAYEREIIHAILHINRNYSLLGDISVNNYLSFFGIPPIRHGDEDGWSIASGIYYLDVECPEKHDKEGKYYVISCVWPYEKNVLETYYGCY